MSGFYGPGPAPAAGPNGTRPSGNGARELGLAAMALLLVATAVSFAVTRSGGSATAFAGAPASARTGASESGVAFPSTSDPTSTAPSASDGGGSASPLPPTSTVPPTAIPRTTTPVQMSANRVRTVLTKFFDGLKYHRLSEVRSAVCPRYRSFYTSTYSTNPKGYEVQKWHSGDITVYPGRTYVEVYVAITLLNPTTGAVFPNNHTWVVDLESNNYYVCGGTK